MDGRVNLYDVAGETRGVKLAKSRTFLITISID